MHVLRHVRSMHIVVILYTSLVLVVDLSGKLQKLVEVDDLKQVVLLQDSSCHEGHLHVTAYLPRELEDVEVEAGNALVEVLVFQH